MSKPPTFEIILGTYEEFLIGYKFDSKEQVLTQSFATHSHCSSVRSVTQSGPYLASGGADDRIIIYDLHTRKEHCMLTHHNATISCLQFTPENSHLISGSADGVIAVVRVGNWQLEKLWNQAHKGSAILDIAVHSSGKLALSLGSDGSLKTWNLVKGRQAYIVNLNSKSKDAKNLHLIRWAPDNVHFVLAGGLYTEVWSIESGGIVKSIKHDNKVTSCAWLSDDILIVGYESGELSKVNVNNENIKTFKGHDSRIKNMQYYEKYLVTCCSNGDIKVWDKDLKEISSCNTGCRHTCMCIVAPVVIKEEDASRKKRLHEDKPIDEYVNTNVNKKKGKKE